jgi:adenosylmethionine---8-amino-7-oxononanoate aminotransferase
MTASPSPLWHPFTQHGLPGSEIFVERAEGAYLWTRDGKRIIDAISSWWVNIHGHCHPALVEAVQRQAGRLDQVIFAGFTHGPAEELAEDLLRMVHPSLRYVFLSDSGSTAVEVAVKMALGYWTHIGRPRRRIIAMEHGYHGDTFGAMALGARSVFNSVYEPYLFEADRLPFPEAGRESRTLEALEALLRGAPEDYAALIIEPLVLGAGGMLMYSASTLREIKTLCERYGVLLIADEVMTGWGRTGARFACDKAGVAPDILCLSKGLTGGFLPIGATLCRSALYDAYYSTDRARTFWHSSSFTGNPLSCAAALANLRLWRELDTDARVAEVSAMQTEQLDGLRDEPLAHNLRQCGTITALDIRQDEAGYLAPVGPALYKFFLNRGVLLRPLGATVYVLPPYCVTKGDLDDVYTAIRQALGALRDGTLQP